MQPEPASNLEWKRWGHADPFFGVASWLGTDRDGPNPWTPEEFYALGASDWADFRKRWWGYGVTTDHCVEIGCGAGRLTTHIAADFSKVTGVDVSEGMLKTAREHVGPEIQFFLGNGTELPLDNASADGVFSSHVFQHFESHEVARDNFHEIARVLRPSGTAMIHLPMYLMPAKLTRLEPLMVLRKCLSDVRAKRRRRLGRPMMRRLLYSIPWLLESLPPIGFRDIEIAMLCTTSNGDLHPFVLMRRVDR